MVKLSAAVAAARLYAMAAAPELDFDDVTYEEDVLRNPYSLKHWWWYLEFKSKAPKKVGSAFVLGRKIKNCDWHVACVCASHALDFSRQIRKLFPKRIVSDGLAFEFEP